MERGVNGQHPRNLKEKLVKNEHSQRQLKFEDVKGETECKIVAARDQELVQDILRIKFGKKKLIINTGYVNDMKKLLST